jgi:hypothetical protein
MRSRGEFAVYDLKNFSCLQLFQIPKLKVRLLSILVSALIR